MRTAHPIWAGSMLRRRDRARRRVWVLEAKPPRDHRWYLSTSPICTTRKDAREYLHKAKKRWPNSDIRVMAYVPTSAETHLRDLWGRLHAFENELRGPTKIGRQRRQYLADAFARIAGQIERREIHGMAFRCDKKGAP